MNRFNAENPDLDGEELTEAMMSAMESSTNRAVSAGLAAGQSPYEELVSAVAIAIANPADEPLKAKSERITAMVWRRAVMSNSERLNKQVNAMLNLLEQDGHITPMAARQISRLMDPNQNPHHG